MAIDLERILTCSLGDFYAAQDEHFDKSKYMPIGVHYQGGTAVLTENFAKVVPDCAIVVVAYRFQTFSGNGDIASGTALVPKDYRKTERAVSTTQHP